MNSLVTGGAGFIGSHVAKICLQLGHEVVVIDDLSGGFEDQIPKGARFIQGSITDTNFVTELFAKYKFDYVYHLAAYAAEGFSHFIRRFNYNNNLLGSINLINESVKHDVKCFVFTSSIAVYGANQLPMTEEMAPKPEDPYGISKYAVELDLLSAHEMFGLPFVIFRPHNVYGENQNIGDRYRNVLGIFMNQIMQNLPMTIFGDGLQTRAFSYIDDVAPFIAKCVHVPESLCQVINIGADEAYSVKHLAEVVSKAFGVIPNIQYFEPRKEVLHAFSDHHKASSLFGNNSFVNLEEGVTRMADWAKKVGVRKSKSFGSIEIKKNMPSSWVSII
jgi:UDP-glucose 4-epimerase